LVIVDFIASLITRFNAAITPAHFIMSFIAYNEFYVLKNFIAHFKETMECVGVVEFENNYYSNFYSLLDQMF